MLLLKGDIHDNLFGDSTNHIGIIGANRDSLSYHYLFDLTVVVDVRGFDFMETVEVEVSLKSCGRTICTVIDELLIGRVDQVCNINYDLVESIYKCLDTGKDNQNLDIIDMVLSGYERYSEYNKNNNKGV